jgi:hypothetical protein
MRNVWERLENIVAQTSTEPTELAEALFALWWGSLLLARWCYGILLFPVEILVVPDMAYVIVSVLTIVLGLIKGLAVLCDQSLLVTFQRFDCRWWRIWSGGLLTAIWACSLSLATLVFVQNPIWFISEKVWFVLVGILAGSMWTSFRLNMRYGRTRKRGA